MSDIEIKLLSSLDKVLPDCTPSADPYRVRLSALRGETVSFQAVYKYNSDGFRSRASLKIETPAGRVPLFSAFCHSSNADSNISTRANLSLQYSSKLSYGFSSNETSK